VAGALEGASGAPRLSVALARLVDLKAAGTAGRGARRAALTAGAAHAGVPQLSRCSRNQSSVDGWASTGAALGRGRGGGCEVFRAPPSLPTWANSSKRASVPDAEPPLRESTVVNALLATGSCLADPATLMGCGCVA
jgi:hypothetical protein